MVKLDNASKAVLAISSLAASVMAHPENHEMDDALMRRGEHAATIQRGLEDCASNSKFIALKERAQTRRWGKAQKLRKARGLDQTAPYKTKRDLTALEEFETASHNMTSLGYTESTSASTLFSSYKNVSCILTPEVTQGPYYVTGEYIRTDVTEEQEGVPVHLEYQYIDVSTCEPATGLHLETWQANATGVYSGIVASDNGNSADSSNLNTTFLRGITSVDSDGVAHFDTIFAGHYQGRATHIHMITHQNGTEHDNGTYSGGAISHVGQLFFDESIRSAVEATAPYSTNTQAITSNDDDMWAPDQADNNYDPFPDWAYLGNDISDGLLMWISVGINMSAEYTVDIAGSLTADGSVVSDSGTMGGGSSSAGGSGNNTGTDEGAMPSGGGSMGSMPMGNGGGSAPSGSFAAGGTMGSISGNMPGETSSSASTSAPGSSAITASPSSTTPSSIKTTTISISAASSSVAKGSSSATVTSSVVKDTSLIKVSSSSATSAVSSVAKSSSSTKASSVVKSSSTARTVSSLAKGSSSSTRSTSSSKVASTSTAKASSTTPHSPTSSSQKKSSSSTKQTSAHKTSSTPKPVSKSSSAVKFSSTIQSSTTKNRENKKTTTSRKLSHKHSSTKKATTTSEVRKGKKTSSAHKVSSTNKKTTLKTTTTTLKKGGVKTAKKSSRSTKATSPTAKQADSN